MIGANRRRDLDMYRILPSLLIALGLAMVPVSLAGASLVVLEAQHALKDKGYDPGALDGIYGPQTQSAIRKFQKESSLPDDGILTLQTLAALGVTTSGGAERAFHTAGTNVKQSYSNGGKEIGKGGKMLGSNMRDGEVVDGAKAFGKNLGRGIANIGRGTGHAAANAAKGVKDTVAGNK
jgi:peptidoglycan hydrolase-like protein with peptidoglycan-binding domain